MVILKYDTLQERQTAVNKSNAFLFLFFLLRARFSLAFMPFNVMTRMSECD